MTEYLLTLSCHNQPGIVAAIATAIFNHGGNITDAMVNVTASGAGSPKVDGSCIPTCPTTAVANVTFSCSYNCTGCGGTMTAAVRMLIDGGVATGSSSALNPAIALRIT